MKTLSILASAALVSVSLLGVGLANRASAESNSTKVVTKVLAVCGPNGAVQIVESDKVPVGCHVSTVNSPPAGI
jgi:hypothetical protein